MTAETLEIASADGTRLVARRISPARTAAVVFLCHGLGEHSGRYDHVMAACNHAGAAVYAVDLRGHGLSGGRRGHVERWTRYVEDVAALFDLAAADNLAGKPWLLLGHSMGGLVQIHVALNHERRLAGMALSGPALGIAARVPPLKAGAGRLLSRYVPILAMSNGLDSRMLSHDDAVVSAYDNDPLVHDRVSARWFTEMTAAMEAAHTRAGSLTLPTLIMHGGDDRIVDPRGSARFAAAYGGPIEHVVYDGYYHEIFNEVGRDRPLAQLQSWLKARL